MSRSIKILVLIISQGLNALIAFLFLPYLARALSINEYGTYGQVILVINILIVTLSFGLGKVIYVYYSNKQFTKEDVFKSNLYSAIVVGLIGAALTMLCATWISEFLNNPKTADLISLYALSLPFAIAYLPLNASLIFYDRVKESAQIAVFTNIVKVGLLLISIQIYHSIFLVFVALIFVSILQCLISFYYVKGFIKLSKGGFIYHLAKQQLWYGLPLGLTSILGVIYKATDSLMISNMLTIEDYAIYKNGAFEIPFIATLYSSIGAIVLPNLAKLFNENDFKSIVKLKRRVISNSFALILPIFLFLVFHSKYLIVMYMSERYADSSIVFTIFTFALLVRINDYEDIFIVSKRNNIVLSIYLFSFLLNTFLNLIMIYFFGKVGAALATIFTLFSIAIISLYLSSKIVQHKIKDFVNFIQIFKIIGGCSTIGVSILLLENISSLHIFPVLVIHMVLSYLFIIKFNLIERLIIINLTNKVPIIGRNISNFIKSI